MTLTSEAATTRSADRRIYSFTTVASAALYIVLTIAPVLAVKLATDLGFSNGQIGLLLSLELGSFALATLPSYFWLRRVNIRKAVYVLATVAVLGNIASGFFTDFGALAVCRIVTALAAGSITVIILGIGVKASNPVRAFGLFVLAQTVVGAVVLFLFPLVYTNLPISALFWTLAALAALVIPVARVLDGDLLKAREGGPQSTATRRDVPRFVAGLAAVFLLFLGAIGVYSFLGQIAVEAGVEVDAVSIAFSVATIVGIAGSLLATVLGERRRAWITVGIAFVAIVVAVGFVFGLTSAAVLTISAVLILLAWNYLPPYLFSAIGRASGSPYALSTTNLLVGIAFAIGPVAAGQILESAGASALITAGVIVLAVAAVAGTFAAATRAHGDESITTAA